MYKYYYNFLFYLSIPISFGFSQNLQDLQKMRAEYEKMMKERPSDKVSIEDNERQLDLDKALPGKAIITPYKSIMGDQDSVDLSLKHFGYDFFTRRDTISFWENLPTPANYLLGPGDELIVHIWGQTQLRQK